MSEFLRSIPPPEKTRQPKGRTGRISQTIQEERVENTVAEAKKIIRQNESSSEEIEREALYKSFIELVDIELQAGQLPNMEEMINRIFTDLVEDLSNLTGRKDFKRNLKAVTETQKFKQEIKSKFEQTYTTRLRLIDSPYALHP
jgi:hypothetical protein